MMIKKTTTWLMVFLFFALGALAGSLGTQQYLHYRFSRFVQKGHPARTDILLKRISKELDLTEVQRKDVRAILEETEVRIDDLRKGFDPRIKGVIDESFGRIRDKLTEDQTGKFDAFRERLVKKADRHRPPPLP